MKTVYTTVFQDDAVVLQSLLRSAGIDAAMIADRMLDVNPLFSTDIKGVSIMVSDEQEDEAKILVEDYRKRRSERRA